MKNIHLLLTSIFILGFGLAASNTVLAQDMEVNSADPAMAEQGTLNLDVEIAGDGFDSQVNVVEFLLPCEAEPCTDTGGVTVKDFTVRGRKKIIANIDVSDDATVAEFDIKVHSTSGGGRGGKGTTLFRVQEKDNGGGSGSTLSAEFCLIMIMWAENLGLASDGQEALNGSGFDYCHDRRERVAVGTGSLPGFRFDSNTKSRPPLRWGYIDFQDGQATALDDDGLDLTTFYSGDYQIEMRFNNNSGGLDLGSMLLDSDPAAPDYSVPVNFHFHELDGIVHFKVAFSEDTDPLSSAALIGNTCVRDNTLDAQVKRIDAGRWSIESNPLNSTGCMWDLNFDPNAWFENQLTGTPIEMPFYFEIEIQ
jgi:hypothetical protein